MAQLCLARSDDPLRYGVSSGQRVLQQHEMSSTSDHDVFDPSGQDIHLVTVALTDDEETAGRAVSREAAQQRPRCRPFDDRGRDGMEDRRLHVPQRRDPARRARLMASADFVKQLVVAVGDEVPL
jgi:hypothetical protein